MRVPLPEELLAAAWGIQGCGAPPARGLQPRQCESSLFNLLLQQYAADNTFPHSCHTQSLFPRSPSSFTPPAALLSCYPPSPGAKACQPSTAIISY